MIKLKQILLEQQLTGKAITDKDITMDVPSDKTGTIIRGISDTDPWEYYFHDEDQMWKTKKRTASKFLDMKKKLIQLYGDEKGNSRYVQATSALDTYIQNREKAELDNKKVEDVSIDDSMIEIIHIDDTQKVKEVWNKVNASKHPEVNVVGKTDDNVYFKIENPRKLHLHKTVFVKQTSFDLQPDGVTAKYNGDEGDQYELYKIK